MTRRAEEVNLPKYQVPAEYRDGVTGVQLPPDLPVYVRAYRLQERDAEGVDWRRGATVMADAFSFGVKVYVKLDYQSGELVVFAEDSDGTSELGRWSA